MAKVPVNDPLVTPTGKVANGNRMGALVPGAAGPWMWLAVELATSPEKVSLTVNMVSVSFKVTKQVPVAGLDWLAAKELTTAMLYVDADNGPALRVYEKLGFTVDHVDRAYVGDVKPD